MTSCRHTGRLLKSTTRLRQTSIQCHSLGTVTVDLFGTRIGSVELRMFHRPSGLNYCLKFAVANSYPRLSRRHIPLQTPPNEKHRPGMMNGSGQKTVYPFCISLSVSRDHVVTHDLPK